MSAHLLFKIKLKQKRINTFQNWITTKTRKTHTLIDKNNTATHTHTRLSMPANTLLVCHPLGFWLAKKFIARFSWIYMQNNLPPQQKKRISIWKFIVVGLGLCFITSWLVHLKTFHCQIIILIPKAWWSIISNIFKICCPWKFAALRTCVECI